MSVLVYTDDEFQQVDDLKSFSKKYHLIHAAGGVVQNDNRDVLLIYRRGKWDLPKGKIENNEPLELGAEREVKEETGLTDLMLRRPLHITYHTYAEKGKDILKETHWYLFDAPGSQPLAPQTEEDINEVIWVSKDKVVNYKKNTYALIKDVLAEAGF
jgi:8-oxo-dGTP pyrophosphatase MutT (NUDIX family)